MRFQKFFLLLCLFALRTGLAAPLQSEEVFLSATDEKGLFRGDEKQTLVCATGVRLPSLAPLRAETNETVRAQIWNRILNEGRALAGAFSQSGFNMVKLPDIPVPEPGIPAAAPYTEQAQYDDFLAACRKEKILVWAELFFPLAPRVISPEAVHVLDDTASREAWMQAVAGAPASDLLLAAPWDPRLEILLQKRLYAWVRAFNPQSGLRRCDDSVFGLYSYCNFWQEDLLSPDRNTLPPFFVNEIRNAWNDFIYEKSKNSAFRNNQKEFLLPGESLEKENLILSSLPEERAGMTKEKIAAIPKLRTDLEAYFLRASYQEHMTRVFDDFRTAGPGTRTLPRLVKIEQKEVFRSLSTILCLTAPRGPRPSIVMGSFLHRHPEMVDASGIESHEEAHHAAFFANLYDADILALPCGNNPQAFSCVAYAYRTYRENLPELENALKHASQTIFDTPRHARLLMQWPETKPDSGLPANFTLPNAQLSISFLSPPAVTVQTNTADTDQTNTNAVQNSEVPAVMTVPDSSAPLGAGIFPGKAISSSARPEVLFSCTKKDNGNLLFRLAVTPAPDEDHPGAGLLLYGSALRNRSCIVKAQDGERREIPLRHGFYKIPPQKDPLLIEFEPALLRLPDLP